MNLLVLFFVLIFILSGLKSSKLTNFEEVVHNVLSIFNSFVLFILYLVHTKLHLNKFLDNICYLFLITQLIVIVNAQKSISSTKGKSISELNLNLLYSFILLSLLPKVILFSINFHNLFKILIILSLFILTTKCLSLDPFIFLYDQIND